MTVTHPGVAEGRRLLDVNDLAKRWGISVQTIYRKRSLGEDLPAAVQIGAQVRWREQIVEAWELAHEAEAV